MNQIDPDKEQENILKILSENPDLVLKEIHQHLVNMEESQFIFSPSSGDGWNDERHIVKALRDILDDEKGLVTTGKTDSNITWSLTKQGRKQIS